MTAIGFNTIEEVQEFNRLENLYLINQGGGHKWENNIPVENIYIFKWFEQNNKFYIITENQTPQHTTNYTEIEITKIEETLL